MSLSLIFEDVKEFISARGLLRVLKSSLTKVHVEIEHDLGNNMPVDTTPLLPAIEVITFDRLESLKLSMLCHNMRYIFAHFCTPTYLLSIVHLVTQDPDPYSCSLSAKHLAETFPPLTFSKVDLLINECACPYTENHNEKNAIAEMEQWRSGTSAVLPLAEWYVRPAAVPLDWHIPKWMETLRFNEPSTWDGNTSNWGSDSGVFSGGWGTAWSNL
jgi:hypothetical protein